MTPEQVIALTRQTIESAFWVAAPVLLSAIVVGLTINIGQVLTSIQDTTVSTVPRLAAVGVILFVLAPWILHHVLVFTQNLFGDFRMYTH